MIVGKFPIQNLKNNNYYLFRFLLLVLYKMRDEEVKRYIIRNLPVGTTEVGIVYVMLVVG